MFSNFMATTSVSGVCWGWLFNDREWLQDQGLGTHVLNAMSGATDATPAGPLWVIGRAGLRMSVTVVLCCVTEPPMYMAFINALQLLEELGWLWHKSLIKTAKAKRRCACTQVWWRSDGQAHG